MENIKTFAVEFEGDVSRTFIVKEGSTTEKLLRQLTQKKLKRAVEYPRDKIEEICKIREAYEKMISEQSDLKEV